MKMENIKDVEEHLKKDEKSVKVWAKGAWSELLSYFDVRNELESQSDIETSIRSGVSFKGSQLLTLIFAIFIASLGLNTNSIPVIIGAMLISPLMGPIIGMGLGIGIRDFDLMKRSLKNISAAVIGSILTSCIYFLISPQYEGSSQLLARTSPSIYDIFVALFGGAAGILSIAAKNKGQVMPGVAIATSLMPPLCTAGYGLATWQMHFFLGALYLFFTNMIFIFVASWIGVRLLRLKRVVYQNEKRARRVRAIAYVIVTGMVFLSAYLTYNMIYRSRFMEKALQFVETQMVFPNTQVFSHKEYIENGKQYIDVTLIGDEMPKDSLQLAMINKMDSCGLAGTVLNIKQGITFHAGQMQTDSDIYGLMQTQLDLRQQRIDSLRSVIGSMTAFSDISVQVAPEVRVLFPNVKDLAVSQMTAAQIPAEQGNVKADTLNMIFVNAPQGLTLAERKKLEEYIGVRMKVERLHIVLNPANFPWLSK